MLNIHQKKKTEPTIDIPLPDKTSLATPTISIKDTNKLIGSLIKAGGLYNPIPNENNAKENKVDTESLISKKSSQAKKIIYRLMVC